MTPRFHDRCGRRGRPGRGKARCQDGCRQSGAVLVTVLFLVLALLTISMSNTHAVLAAAKSARAERDRLIAHAAAEAALLDAEADIDGAAGPASPRNALFDGTDAFPERCDGAGERAGLCRQAAPPSPPAWQSADLAGDAGTEYGRFSGRVLPLGAGPLPARAPRYLIELLSGPGAKPLYRITAIGFGADAATLVVLQSYYRRAGAGPPGGPGRPARRDALESPGEPEVPAGPGISAAAGPARPPGTPGRRLGWREIGNWRELHRNAS
jgi:type IV pilus assembly protein PilX